MHPVSFDTAAPFYDDTRGFPPGISDVVADAARDLLAGRPNVLEIGVGTGRIARPLLVRGVRVTGLDLSRPMMARLLSALEPGAAPPDLVQGAAEHLPFAAATFDALVSVHVFHLIPRWRAAQAEVRRVLRSGGLFLNGYEWRPADAPGARVMDQWRAIVQDRGGGAQSPTTGAGTHDYADTHAALLAAGAQFREVKVGYWTTTRTLARGLESIEHRTWSSTWHLPDDFFAACLADLRAWAVANLGPLDTEFITPHSFLWQCYQYPPSS